MYARPGYAQRTPKALSQLALPDLPIIHEDPAQEILGGSPGERYHLTEDEHDFVVDKAANGIMQYEAVCAEGEIVFDGITGDLLMAIGDLYVA